MTPEEWANTVGLNWHHHEQPVSLHATPDWPKNYAAIAAAIRAAVTEEREACARLIQTHHDECCTAVDCLSAAIRRRGEGQP